MQTSSFAGGVAVGCVCLLAAASAVVEAFWATYDVVGVVSAGTLAVLLTNPLLAYAGRALARRTYGAVLPPASWLLVVLVLGTTRTEGDIVVPGTSTGLVFIFAGSVSGAVAISRSGRARAAAPNGPALPGSSAGDPGR